MLNKSLQQILKFNALASSNSNRTAWPRNQSRRRRRKGQVMHTTFRRSRPHMDNQHRRDTKQPPIYGC